MSDTELEKLMPRCKTSDKEDFPDEHLDDSERCWNCRVWEAIDKEVTRSRIDELKALVPPEQFKDYVKLTGHEACTICGFNSEVFRRHLESRIKAIQEEGTDNG